MGLQQRQWVETYGKPAVADRNAHLKELMGGGELAFEVDWASFYESMDACLYLNSYLTKIYNAIEWVTRSAIGKQVVGDAIDRILVRNVAEPAQKQLALDGKVLKIEVVLSSSADEGRFGDSDLIKFLENL